MERLREKALQLSISLNDMQMEMFNIYYEMLINTNKVMNLTAITQLDEVILKHFIDSISVACVYDKLMDFTGCGKETSDNKDTLEKLKILDLGTGAGFPGIPLKIVFPDIEIVLMDSLNKRVRFLQDVIDELKLTGISAVHGRAEELSRDKQYRESFDLCVSRAVANLSVLSEYCIPFVKTGGTFISYKSADIDEEINNAGNAIKVLGGNLTAVKKLVLPGSDIERSFVIIDKIKNTPKVYPRKAGTATKNPL